MAPALFKEIRTVLGSVVITLLLVTLIAGATFATIFSGFAVQKIPFTVVSVPVYVYLFATLPAVRDRSGAPSGGQFHRVAWDRRRVPRGVLDSGEFLCVVPSAARTRPPAACRSRPVASALPSR